MKDHQGVVVLGNEKAHEDGKLTPTVVLNPSPESPLMVDETFGPILIIQTYKDIDEAVKYINARDKPLAVYYFGANSTSNKNLLRLQNETSSGAFLVNEIGFHMMNSDLPFGGVGGSGYGRYHGREGFNQCSNTKAVLKKDAIKMWPFNVVFPPYTPDKRRIITLLSTTFDYT